MQNETHVDENSVLGHPPSSTGSRPSFLAPRVGRVGQTRGAATSSKRMGSRSVRPPTVRMFLDVLQLTHLTSRPDLGNVSNIRTPSRDGVQIEGLRVPSRNRRATWHALQ
eukprot:2689522-Amphidinium_carterae.1